jgi:GTPase
LISIQRQEGVALAAVDAAVEQFHVLLLAAHHVDHVEALQVGILEVGQFFLEDHRGRGAVAIEQREAAVRLGRSVVLMMERMGVMPLPAAKAR